MPDQRVLQQTFFFVIFSDQKDVFIPVKGFLNGNILEMKKFHGIFINLKMMYYRSRNYDNWIEDNTGEFSVLFQLLQPRQMI